MGHKKRKGKVKKRLTENEWDIERNGKDEKRPTENVSLCMGHRKEWER